jgi:hypothetical protein
MENIQNNNDDNFKATIALYAQIIYELMQQQQSFYDSMMPKTTFKLIEVKEEKQKQLAKIAA